MLKKVMEIVHEVNLNPEIWRQWKDVLHVHSQQGTAIECYKITKEKEISK